MPAKSRSLGVGGKFDEAKHPRSHGKFASKPGADKAKPEKKPRARPAAFNAAPFKKKLDKLRSTEAKHRLASIELKSKMAALKAEAKTATPKRKEAIRKRFESFAKRREALKQKALAAKEARKTVNADMATARAAHRDKIKATKTAKPTAKTKTNKIDTQAQAQAAKPVHTPEPKRELLQHDAVLASEAAAKVELTRLHMAIESRLDSMGFKKSGHEESRGFVMIEQDHKMPMANGYRHWDGTIVLRASVVANIRDFGAALGGEKASGRISALEHRHKELEDKLNTLFRKGAKEEYKTADAERIATHKTLETLHGDGMRTMVHETIHGYGPGSSATYRSHGAQIEEITTEVSARVVMNQMFGSRIAPHNQGSYFHDISGATNAIHELTGKSHAESFHHLQEASLAYKRRSVERDQLRTPEEVRAAFAYDISRSIGKRVSEVEPVLVRYLNEAAQTAQAHKL